MLQELHIPLAPDEEHKNIFQDIPVVGFRNGKNLKDHLVRAKLQNIEVTGMPESCGKRNCQVCNFMCNAETFSTKACSESQSKILNYNSLNVVYLLKYSAEYVEKLVMLVRQKRNLERDLIILKVHTGPAEKET